MSREATTETGMRYPAAPQSKPLLDMEVANYCEGLDPSYSTLGFENAEVLYGGGGKLILKISNRRGEDDQLIRNWAHTL